MITETGQGLVELVKVGREAWDIRRFPESPLTYVLLNQHGAVLVSYEGREWSDPTSPEPRHVTEIRYQLTIVKKNMQRFGAEDGLEEQLVAIAAEIEGQTVNGFTFFPTRDVFLDHIEGTWYYLLDAVGYADKTLRGL